MKNKSLFQLVAAVGLTQLLASFAFAQASPCPSEADVRSAAQKEWGQVMGTRSTKALVDYKMCEDFHSCYEKSCSVQPPPQTPIENYFDASRPFVMCNKTHGSSKGTVLMVHGFSDSPYTQGAIAETLTQNGFNVVTVLLPGHGADSIDREDSVTLQEWREGVDHGVKLARKLFGEENLTMTGFSTGGMLAVDYLQTHQNSGIKNLVLFDPALALPFTSEATLSRDRNPIHGIIQGIARGKGANKKDEIEHPSRTPMRWVDDPVAIMDGILATRANQARINVKTLAFFTSGKNDEGGYTIDAPKAQKALCSSGWKRGIVPAPLVKCDVDTNLHHSQVVIREHIGNCATSADANPSFNEMTRKIVDQLSESAAATGSAVQTRQAGGTR